MQLSNPHLWSSLKPDLNMLAQHNPTFGGNKLYVELLEKLQRFVIYSVATVFA